VQEGTGASAAPAAPRARAHDTTNPTPAVPDRDTLARVNLLVRVNDDLTLDPAAGFADRGSFADLTACIERKLWALRRASRPKNSRAAERLIFPLVEEALKGMDPGFARAASRRYAGFWRRPEADGIWRRGSGMPASFALEVKLDEDSNNPLCQAVEVLGHVDAMVHVRVTKPGGGMQRVRSSGNPSGCSRQAPR